MDKYGVSAVRGCEVIAQYDEARKEISHEFDGEKIIPDGNLRHLTVLLDPFQYKMDLEDAEIAQQDVYSSFQLIIRRRPHENTFKAILSTILSLLDEEPQLPEFLEELILGYGDPEESTSRHNMFKLNSHLHFSFFDTFLDAEHFDESFTRNELIPEELRNSKKYEEMTYFTKNRKKNDIRFTNKQVEAITSAMYPGLTLVVGPPG
jgi:intron-binding protein aquarius